MSTDQKLSLIAEIMNAYSDCNGSKGPRNLKFIASAPLDVIELQNVMAAAIPDGYNGFSADKSLGPIIKIFGEHAEYFIAREASVCLYVKPKHNLWFSRRHQDIEKLATLGDEVLFCPEKCMFRVWWD